MTVDLQKGSEMSKWLAFAIVTSLTGVCLAQTQPTSKKEHQSKPLEKQKDSPTARFSTSMLEGGRVDPRYRGMPLEQVIDTVERMSQAKRGEFESTTEFNARRAKTLSAKVVGDLGIEDTFAFVAPVHKGGEYIRGLTYTFNADSGELLLLAIPASSEMNGIGAPNYDPHARRDTGEWNSFDLEDTKHESTYLGSNAFGASVSVTKVVVDVFGIAAHQIAFLKERSTPAAQLKLDNQKAARELPLLKALVVMKLTDPYVVYSFRHDEPTRDHPFEFAFQFKYLTGNVLGIVYYSGLTGEIFARIPEYFGIPTP
jgi:hypothetical protein